MRSGKRFLAALLSVALLSGCSQPMGTQGGIDPTTGSASIDNSFAKTDEEMFTDRDHKTDYDESEAVRIMLNGTTSSASSSAVTVSGSTVTITRAGTYLITGTLTDGMLVVDAGESDKLQLIFSGVQISSSTSAPLYILKAEKVFVTLTDGTENALSGGESFVAIDDNNIDGAVFSKQDLTFNGAGSLTVTSPAGHGIVCKDDLVFTGGKYTVNAASHGLQANDSVRIANAAITIDAGKDGIHTENDENAEKGYFYMSGGSLNIEAEGDGISAAAFAQLEDGTIDILAGGGSENGTKSNSGGYGDFMGGMGGRPGGRAATASDDESTSMKGIKATGSLLMNGGSITVNSADDTLHANDSVAINGGKFNLKTGDDGVHADGNLVITNCDMEISECYEGLEAERIYVSGGNIKLKASDDGINAAGGTDSSGSGGRDQMFGRPGGMGGMGGSSNGYIEISGGDLYINSSGDGIDANGSFLICGGYTVIVGPTQGDTATLDYDKEGKITGGTFIGTGASGMAQTFSSNEQGVFAVRVGNQAAGAQITLQDKDGNKLLSFAPELSFAVVILSCPEMKSGESYTITVGSVSGTFEAS